MACRNGRHGRYWEAQGEIGPNRERVRLAQYVLTAKVSKFCKYQCNAAVEGATRVIARKSLKLWPSM